ncbi:Alpha/Beta hydrolase protein [Pseudomassariella vexata]|uniref:Carboxylic ester hydrolase n=1 Tax=Pseudomassariella vexata TaxID=1141098 RepID=A0A1Y2E6K6_9PEZI|nr:Alpha/Beta hydrolase protein [Pseudomassariella vexata]ORY67162.1 Alpha/Beta hydrolase protein [Pseudomassariella vexata]
MKNILSFGLTSLVSVALAQVAPTVDLGYEIHGATVNTTGDYYLFSSVPYAQQPVGDLRFQKPVALSEKTNGTVNNGSTTTMCMQAYPAWILALQAQAYGVDEATIEAILASQPGQTESCLVLDVYVPAAVFNKSVAETPVLLWIHGGGFTSGSKISSGSPAGLIARSQLSNESEVIFVSINYRLGMFGWLAGDDVTPNLGLYDQRMAMEWVQKYISRFGGDPNKLTVMGESAGASSILHHITGYGGAVSAPFQRAISQSPAFQFNINTTKTYDLTLDVASNVTEMTISSVEQLKSLDLATLQAINQRVVIQAMQGTFNYGIVTDGTYVPKTPQVLLLEGKFDHSVNVMASHMSNESIPFIPSSLTTAANIQAYLTSSLPQATPETIAYILQTVYPDVLDGTYPWTTEFARAATIASEINFACSTNYLATAFANKTYNYVFSYPPGYHAADLPYIFFNGDTTTADDGLPVNETLAHALQDYIVAFVQTGKPQAEGLVDFPEYGSEAAVLDFTYGGVVRGVDDLANPRCDWIQQAMAEGLI